MLFDENPIEKKSELYKKEKKKRNKHETYATLNIFQIAQDVIAYMYFHTIYIELEKRRTNTYRFDLIVQNDQAPVTFHNKKDSQFSIICNNEELIYSSLSIKEAAQLF